MAAVFHQNSKYSVIIGSSVLVRIANSCKSLALNNIVQICYSLMMYYFKMVAKIQNGCHFSLKYAVFRNNFKFYVS